MENLIDTIKRLWFVIFIMVLFIGSLITLFIVVNT
jgi:hypothetical protein